MDPLTKIGAVLLMFGLLVFSFKLIRYNRRKYADDETQATVPPTAYQFRNNTIRYLALAILLIGIVILYIFNR